MHRPVVVHDGRRFVADVPPGLDQAPDQIDVLAAPQPGIEQRVVGHLTADQERGARHVGDPAQRADEPGRSAPVQRGAHGFVARQGRGGNHRERHDPGRHGGDQRVVEVAQERLQPVRIRARSPSR